MSLWHKLFGPPKPEPTIQEIAALAGKKRDIKIAKEVKMLVRYANYHAKHGDTSCMSRFYTKEASYYGDVADILRTMGYNVSVEPGGPISMALNISWGHVLPRCQVHVVHDS